MAFSGTELEEVTPRTNADTYSMVCSGGGKVFAIGHNGTTAILDTATSEAYLYTSTGGLANSGDAGWNYGNMNIGGAHYVDGAAYYLCKSSKYLSFASISPTGGNSGPWASLLYDNYGYYQAANLTSAGDYLHGHWTFFATTTYWVNMNMVTKSVSISSSSKGRRAVGVASALYDPQGATLTAYDETGVTAGSSWTLPVAPSSLGVASGNVIWWGCGSAGMVWFDTSTGTSGHVAATPSGFPGIYSRPVILDGVAYSMTEAGPSNASAVKMVAFKLSTGQWKSDDLVTARAARFGVGVGSGKLWIPSTVTP